MLFYFLFSFVIVSSAFPDGHIDSENVTVPTEDGAAVRIAGGDEAERGARAAPFQAQITREGAMFCSGTILNDRHIVTAAHCVEGAKPQELTVRVGSNIRGEGTVLPIEEIVLHPDYDYPQNNFDIAYMRTVMPIPIGATIRSAFIATNPSASVPRELHVTGWGYQEGNQKKLADKLRAVDLPVISNSECQVFYPMISITKNMICGYSLRDMDKGTCVGDGGDPATVSRRLIGVSSFAKGCGSGMAPSVFTYVDAKEVREFILNGISEKGAKRPGRPAERPQKPSKGPEKGPEERPEKSPKVPKGEPDYYERCSGDSLECREDVLERPEQLPDERPEKTPKVPKGEPDYYERCSGDSIECSENALERPEKLPDERPGKVPKDPKDEPDYYGGHHGDSLECRGDALERSEKLPDERPEKSLKAHKGAESDYYEGRLGDSSECRGDALERPEKTPDEHPEELLKRPQRRPADRPQKRPAEREP